MHDSQGVLGTYASWLVLSSRRGTVDLPLAVPEEKERPHMESYEGRSVMSVRGRLYPIEIEVSDTRSDTLRKVRKCCLFTYRTAGC